METAHFVDISPCSVCPRGCESCSGKELFNQPSERHLKLTSNAKKNITKLVNGAHVDVAGETGDPHYYKDLEGLHKVLVGAKAKEITYWMNGDLFLDKQQAKKEVSKFKKMIGNKPIEFRYKISVGYPKTGVKDWKKITSDHPEVNKQYIILQNLDEIANQVGVNYEVVLHGRFRETENPSRDFLDYCNGFLKNCKGAKLNAPPIGSSRFKKVTYMQWKTAGEVKAMHAGAIHAIHPGIVSRKIQPDGRMYDGKDLLCERPIGNIHTSR
jgi:hypothetical protein